MDSELLDPLFVILKKRSHYHTNMYVINIPNMAQEIVEAATP